MKVLFRPRTRCLCHALVALALMSAFSIIGAIDAFSQPLVTVNGYVQLQYQRSHEGILVEFLPGPPPAQYRWTTTDANGYFALLMESPAGYKVRFSKAGYAADSIPSVFLYKDTTFATRVLDKYESVLPGGTYPKLVVTRVSSPYRLYQNLTCDTLIIEAGCRIRVENYARVAVLHGLQFSGLVDDSIRLAWIRPDSACYPYPCPSGPGLEFFGETASVSYTRIDPITSTQGPEWYPFYVNGQDVSVSIIGSSIGKGNSDYVPAGYGKAVVVKGKGVLTVTSSEIDGLVMSDSSVHSSIINSDIEPLNLFVNGSASHTKFHSNSGGGLVFKGSLTDNTIINWDYSFLAGSRVERCSTETEYGLLNGTILDNAFLTRNGLNIGVVDSVINNTFYGFGGFEPGEIDTFTNCVVADNDFCTRAPVYFGSEAIVFNNSFDCACPYPIPAMFAPYDAAVHVLSGATFHDNVVTLAESDPNPAYGLHGRPIGIIVGADGVAANNIVIGRDDDYSQIGIRVDDLGTSVNNLVMNCLTGIFGASLASVHHNDSWTNGVRNFDGIPILGINVKTNPKGDSCDVFNNISLDPLVIVPARKPCDVSLPACSSPLLGAGDPNFGSRNIWLPDGACTEVKEINSGAIPFAYKLDQNSPNPFNSSTSIHFQIPKTSTVVIEVRNILGQRVCTLVNQQLHAGRFLTIWDGENDNENPVSSGIYFYTLKAGDFSETKKMVILK